MRAVVSKQSGKWARADFTSGNRVEMRIHIVPEGGQGTETYDGW